MKSHTAGGGGGDDDDDGSGHEQEDVKIDIRDDATLNEVVTVVSADDDLTV